MDKQEIIRRCSEILLGAANSGVTCAPIRELIGDTDIDTAYMVQLAVNATRFASGSKAVGAKIGLTSEAVQ